MKSLLFVTSIKSLYELKMVTQKETSKKPPESVGNI